MIIGCTCGECQFLSRVEFDTCIESDPYCTVQDLNVVVQFVNGDPAHEAPQYLSPREARVLAHRLLVAANQAEGA